MNLARAEQGSEIAASLVALRQSTARWLLRERNRTRVTTGIPRLDDPLAGGWPRGRVGELVGSISSGRTSVATATVAAATRNGEVVAWIDAADAFDPGVAREAGVVLERVLWVRSAGIRQAVRAVEIVLEGGIPLVVMDLAGGGGGRFARCRHTVQPGASVASGRRLPIAGRDDGFAIRIPPHPRLSAAARAREGDDSVGEGGKRHSATRLRLARAVERAGAVALVLADRPWTGTLAGVTVQLANGTAKWGGEPGTPRWLAGLAVTFRLGRGSASGVEGSVDLRRLQGEAAVGNLVPQEAENPPETGDARLMPPPESDANQIPDVQLSTFSLQSVASLMPWAQRAGA